MKVGMIIAGLFLILVGCGGPEERKAEYLERAQAYIGEGNYPKARVALRNVLKIDPKDARGYFLFAQVEEYEQNWRTAFEHYLRVVELEPAHREALLKLGRFYLEGRAWEKVDEVTRTILTHYPNDSGARTLLAAKGAVQGELPDAIRTMEGIVRDDKKDSDAVLVLATLYTARNDLDQAIELLRPAVQRFPDNVEILIGLGAVLSRKKDWEGAETAFIRAHELEPYHFAHHTRLASLYTQMEQPQKAVGILEEGIAAQTEDPVRWRALAEFYAGRKDLDLAERTLIRAQRALPRNTQFAFLLGELLERQNRSDRAREIYERLVSEYGDDPPGLQANIKLAGLDFSQGQVALAEQRVATVLEKNPRDVEGLLMKGKLALSGQDGRTAVEAFRTVMKDQPQAADVQVLLAQAYMMLGESHLAKDSLERAIQTNPALLEAQRMLAALDAGQGRFQKAEERLGQVLAQRPEDLSALGMLLSLQVSNRQWAEVGPTLEKMKKAGEDEFRLRLMEGQTFLAQQQWQKAEEAFEAAAGIRPQDPAPLFGWVQVVTKQRQFDRAQARLSRVLADRPEDPYAHGLLGEVLVLSGRTQEAQEAFRAATALKPDWPLPWLDQASLMLKEGNIPEVLAWLKDGFAANSQSAELGILLASLLERTGDVDGAIQIYESVLAANPRAGIAANNLASLLTDQKGSPKDLERALQLSEGLMTGGEANPYFLDTLGWVYVKLGRQDEGIRMIRKAMVSTPNHPLLNYHLGVAYHQAGNAEEAKTYLAKALQSKQGFGYEAEAKALLGQLQG